MEPTITEALFFYAIRDLCEVFLNSLNTKEPLDPDDYMLMIEQIGAKFWNWEDIKETLDGQT